MTTRPRSSKCSPEIEPKTKPTRSSKLSSGSGERLQRCNAGTAEVVSEQDDKRGSITKQPRAVRNPRLCRLVTMHALPRRLSQIPTNVTSVNDLCEPLFRNGKMPDDGTALLDLECEALSVHCHVSVSCE